MIVNIVVVVVVVVYASSEADIGVDKKQRCRVSAEETWGEALGTG